MIAYSFFLSTSAATETVKVSSFFSSSSQQFNIPYQLYIFFNNDVRNIYVLYYRDIEYMLYGVVGLVRIER